MPRKNIDKNDHISIKNISNINLKKNAAYFCQIDEIWVKYQIFVEKTPLIRYKPNYFYILILISHLSYRNISIRTSQKLYLFFYENLTYIKTCFFSKQKNLFSEQFS